MEEERGVRIEGSLLSLLAPLDRPPHPGHDEVSLEY